MAQYLENVNPINYLVSVKNGFKVFRHLALVLDDRLVNGGNVERQPGPFERDREQQGQQRHPQQQRSRGTGSSLVVTTYNVRGLKEKTKLRHIINHFNKAGSNKNKDLVACLQEVYLENPGKIPFLWRGNYHLTPGRGNSGGCLTLLSAHINIIASKEIENRAHFLDCQKADDTSVSFVVANIYAPNPNTNQKIEFYNEFFEALHEFEEYHLCSNTIVAGDFNRAFASHEMKNRMYSSQEQRVSAVVKGLVESANLKDIWDSHKGYTWRRANTDCFSTIDRILYQTSKFHLMGVKENWSLSSSDHAAVECCFNLEGQEAKSRSKIPRIDPSLAKSPEIGATLYREVTEMLGTMPDGWDPHMKLEFAKVCIRTVAEKLQAERKRREKLEEESLNDDLNEAITILENEALTEYRTNDLIEQIEVLRGRKAVIIEEKGRRLADRLGSKWYNEGEKSTRYFMRLLNRQMPDDFKTILKEDGSVITEADQVKVEIR